MKYIISWNSKCGDDITHEYYTGKTGFGEYKEMEEFSREPTKMKIYDSIHECSGDFYILARHYEGCDLRIGEI